MDSPLEVLERDAEWYSVYLSRLRKEYSKRSYFNLLKNIVVKKFTERRIGSLVEENDIIHFVISGDIQSLLEGFVKEYANFIKGRSEYYDAYLEKLTGVLLELYITYSKKRNDTYLLDTVMRKLIIYSVWNEGRVSEVVNKFNTVLSHVKRKVREKGAFVEEHISSYIEKGLYFRKPLDLLHFRSFLGMVGKESQWIVEILSEYANDLFREVEIAKNRTRDVKIDTSEMEAKRLRERLLKFLSNLKEQLMEDIPPVFLVDRLTRLESTMRVHMGAARGLLYEKSAESSLNSPEEIFHIPKILGFIGIKPENLIPEPIKDKMIKDIEKGTYDIPETLKKKRIFKKAYEYEKIWKEIEKFYTGIFEPSIYHKIFEEMVEAWPVPKIKKTSLEEARWIGVKARYGGVIFLPEGLPEYKKKRVDLELFRLGRVVSVLIYDIRGSTFMGEKLRNAKREEEIRRKFQKRLIRVALNHGGFPLKDTGDGGIVFFSANSYELYEKFQEIRLGKVKDIHEKLIASRFAAKQAVLCARDMVKESENFVRENLENYKEWFKSVEGVELQFRGITYEKLPPSFKKIFQIGVGIASGDPETDISFDLNAFGEPDLTGNIVRYANTYSKEKEKEQSVIMIDARTALSFLLSLEKFEEFEKGKRLKDAGYESNTFLLLSEMKRWYNGFYGKYTVENYGIGIKQTVERLMGKNDDQEEIQVKERDFTGILSPEKAFRDLKSGRVFALYRIIPKGG